MHIFISIRGGIYVCAAVGCHHAVHVFVFVIQYADISWSSSYFLKFLSSLIILYVIDFPHSTSYC